MNAFPRLSATLFSLAVSCVPLAAQEKPPPWWGVADDVTVSLYFDFNLPPPNAFVPAFSEVPSWYTGSVGTPTNLTWLPTLTSHNGVLALVGTGAPQTAALEMKIDNDPHIDWIKIFWFQYDEFRGASGSVAASIRKDLGKYGRATVTEEGRDNLGAGWERVTISAKLIPQPDDEKLDWSFFENSFGTEAIDNLYVNSKCVKPGDDEKGDALGLDDGFASPILGHRCRGVGVTEGPGPAFTRTYWVSTAATTPGANHQLLQVNQAGSVIVTTPLPSTLATASLGGQDVAVETVDLGGGAIQQFIYVLVDERQTLGGEVRLYRSNTSGALLAPIDLGGFPPIPPQRFGLAFDPSGNLGAGTFWVSDENGNVYEFSRAGALLATHTVAVTLPGAGFAGLGYDATFGNFYGFSPDPRPSPFGPLQVNGFEWSGHQLHGSGTVVQGTGTEFLGNLNVAGSTPKGGIAAGLEVYRRRGTGAFRMACVVSDTSNNSFLYELKGPYRFGWSQMGTCGMQGGPPFEGGTTFAVTLRGLPNSVAAFLYAGLSNTTSTLGPLPIPLGLLGPGFDESYMSISLDVPLGGHSPVAPGRFVAPVLLPPAGGLSYVPIFFQWIVLDTTVPGLMAMSQAGKTIAY